MTHADLVKRAERWLRNSAHRLTETETSNGKRRTESLTCAVVLCEPCGGAEEPDAIGWYGGRGSILIECKATRRDFLADRKKRFRTALGQRFAAGRFRYYMTPQGLVRPAELPSGWGLLECLARKIKVVRYSDDHEYDLRRELHLLWSECRKIQIVQAGGALISTKAGRRIADACASSAPSP